MKIEELLREMKIAVGNGTADFTMQRGSFRYSEKTRWEKMLTEGISFRDIEWDGKNGTLPLSVGELQITLGETVRLHVAFKDSVGVNRLILTLPAKKEEHVYGCGETFSRFNLRGQKVRIWVAEHQNASRIAKKMIRQTVFGVHPEKILPFEKYESYYAQPTFVSSEKYFVHADTDSFAEFDFTNPDRHVLRIHDSGDILIGTADSYEELSGKLSDAIGRQKELPDWLYDGIILGMQGGTETVEKKLAEAEKAGTKICGIWCQDWEGCRVTKFGYQLMWNWKWDESLYPGLDRKIPEWKKKGIHFLGYINPFLAIEKELYAYASAHGYCVKNKEGKDYMVTITTFPAAMVDFTNPAAYEWIKGIIKENLIGLGLDGWMADFAEYLPTDCVLADGEDPAKIHNRWPAIWAKINSEAIQECGKENEIFFFTRSGSTGTVRYSPMMWNGDQHVDWSRDDGLPSVIPATLSLAMSGYGITHSDAGGYTTILKMTRSRELMMRWLEMNVFSPLLRTHEGNQPDKNVQYDSDAELLSFTAEMSRLHAALKPYLKACVKEEASSGTPVMRPLFYHYEEPQAYREGYEYLLGRDILAAPVLKEGAVTKKVYLPYDRWIHLFTGKEYEGGTAEVDAPIGCPPVFIRAESPWREELEAAFRNGRTQKEPAAESLYEGGAQ